MNEFGNEKNVECHFRDINTGISFFAQNWLFVAKFLFTISGFKRQKPFSAKNTCRMCVTIEYHNFWLTKTIIKCFDFKYFWMDFLSPFHQLNKHFYHVMRFHGKHEHIRIEAVNEHAMKEKLCPQRIFVALCLNSLSLKKAQNKAKYFEKYSLTV